MAVAKLLWCGHSQENVLGRPDQVVLCEGDSRGLAGGVSATNGFVAEVVPNTIRVRRDKPQTKTPSVGSHLRSGRG